MVTSPNVSQMNINNIDEASRRGLLKGNATPNTISITTSNPPVADPSSEALLDCYSRYNYLGREFVRQYYTMMGENPSLVFRFYSADSIHTFNEGMPLFGQAMIAERFSAMNLDSCHTKIRSVDAHKGLHGMVVVQVVGELSINGAQARRFVQTFVLAPRTERKYYVHNDIFRYLDDLFVDKTTDADLLTSESLATTNDKCAMAVNGLHEEDTVDINQRVVQQVSYRHQPLPPRTLATSTSMTDSGIVPFSAESSPEWPTSTTAALPTAAQSVMAQSQTTTPVTVGNVYTQLQPSAVPHQLSPQAQRPDAIMPSAPTTVVVENVGGPKVPAALSADVDSPLSVAEDLCRPTSAAGKDSSAAASNAGDDTEDGGVGGGSTAATSPESWARRVAGKQATVPVYHKPKAAQPLVAAAAQSAPSPAAAIPAAALPQPTVIDALPPQTSRESPAPSSSSGGGAGGVSYGGGRGTGPYRQSQHYSGGGRGSGHDAASAADESGREIFVRFLPDNIVRSELEDVFSKIGPVESVHVVSRQGVGGRSLNSFAFIRFDSVKSVNEALAQRTFFIRERFEIRAEMKVDRGGRPMGGGDRMNMGDRMNSGGGGGPSMRGRGGMGGRGGYRGGRGSSGGGNAGPGSRFYTNSNQQHQRPQQTGSGFGGGGGSAGGGFNQPSLQTTTTAAVTGGGGGF